MEDLAEAGALRFDLEFEAEIFGRCRSFVRRYLVTQAGQVASQRDLDKIAQGICPNPL